MFHHNLTLQSGILSSHCIDENDFVEKSTQLINEIKKYDDIGFDDMLYGNPTRMSEFQSAVIEFLTIL